jgi:hypothetical protein
MIFEDLGVRINNMFAIRHFKDKIQLIILPPPPPPEKFPKKTAKSSLFAPPQYARLWRLHDV